MAFPLLRTAKNLGGDLIESVLLTLRRRTELRKYRQPSYRKLMEAGTLTKEEKQEIDRFYLENYGKKIPYFWHRAYKGYTGKFDLCFFPEYLYIPEFENYMNSDAAYARILSDKNMLPIFAGYAGCKMPKEYLICSRGVYQNGDRREISREEAVGILRNCGEVFIKPSVDSDSGQGCLLLTFRDGVCLENQKTARQVLLSLKKNFTVQERIVCHEEIRRLYAGSVNTFRVLTYRWKSEVKVGSVIMRLGIGNAYVDNVHAGGLFIAVDEQGNLGEKAMRPDGESYLAHPDSGTVFQGYRIHGFGKVTEKAKRMHELVPQIGIIHWDFTLNEQGEPVLIEANTRGGGIWVFNAAHGKGPFGDDTEEILRWCRFMRKKAPHKRSEYRFGDTDTDTDTDHE